MKKGIIFILLLSFLVGCGSGGTSNPDDPIEISFWHVFAESFGGPAINEIVEDFNNSQDDIIVNAVYNPDMYPGLMRNLQAEVVAGNSPSIVMIGYNYLKYFEANFNYVDPQELVDKLVPEDSNFIEKTFLPNILSLAEVDGNQVGLPHSISTPVLFYNADLFEEAGLDPNKPPKTWAEVQAAAKAISEQTSEYGFYMQEYADNWAIQGLLEGNGGKMLDENGKATFSSPESEVAYQTLADMVLVDKSALHITADEGIQAFINGNVGMLVGSSAKIGQVETGVDFELRGAEFPLFEGKERRIPAGGNFLPIMSKTEEEQKASWEFMKFLMQPKYLGKWSIHTGYLPPSEIVTEDADVQQHMEDSELYRIAFEQFANIYPWAAYPGDIGPRAEDLFAQTRDKILSGSISVRDALKEAQDELNKLLEE